MSRILSITLSLSLFTLFLVTGLDAQDLNPFQKRELAKVVRYLEEAEKLHTSDPNSSTFEFKFQMAARTLKRLPAGHPEVKPLLERLARIDPQNAPKPPRAEPPRRAPVPAKPSRPEPRRQQPSPSQKTDSGPSSQEIAQLEKKIGDSLRRALSAGKRGVESDKPNYSNKPPKKRQAEKENRKTIESMQWFEKADEYLGQLQALLGDQHETVVRYRKSVVDTRKEIAEHSATMKTKYAGVLFKRIESAFKRSESNFEQGVSQNKLHLVVRAGQTFGLIEHYLNSLTEYLGPEDARIGEIARRVKTARAEYRTQKKKFEGQLAASAKAMPELYRGADAEELRTLAQETYGKRYPKDEILAVRLVEKGWSRKASKQWNSAIKSWQIYDYSELVFVVFVKQDDTYAYVYPGSIRRDHTKGDQTRVHTDSREGKGALVGYKMLVENVDSN